MAQASGLGVRLVKDDIVIQKGVLEISELFGISDSFAAISEGSLILTCRPHKSGEIIKALKTKGIPASLAGEMTDPANGIVVVEKGEEKPFEHPKVDPFWNAFYKTLSG